MKALFLPKAYIASVIAAVLFVVIVVGCKPEIKKDPTSEYPKPFSILHTETMEQFDNGIVLGSDGHEYLITNWEAHGENVEHYIDCILCKNRECVLDLEPTNTPQ